MGVLPGNITNRHGRSPPKLIDKFKAELGGVPVAQVANVEAHSGLLASELHRLADLREVGVLDDAEFVEAKKKLLA